MSIGFIGRKRIGNYRLFCYEDNAQYFDATTTQLAETRWPVDNVETVAWGQAARAATEYCRTKGFSRGFMTGHQNRETKGIVCQR